MAALLLGLAAAPAAQAAVVTTTIDFNNLIAGSFVGGSDFTVGGGQFNYGQPAGGDAQRAFDIGSGNIVMVDGNLNNGSGAFQTLSRIGGGSFSVLSIDIADLSNNPLGGGGSGGVSGSGGRIGLDPGNLAYSPVSSTFTTVDLSGFADLQNITAFAINIVSSFYFDEFVLDDFAIDNIVVQYDVPSTAVPEPATLALLGIGLAALGWRRRRAG